MKTPQCARKQTCMALQDRRGVEASCALGVWIFSTQHTRKESTACSRLPSINILGRSPISRPCLQAKLATKQHRSPAASPPQTSSPRLINPNFIIPSYETTTRINTLAQLTGFCLKYEHLAGRARETACTHAHIEDETHTYTRRVHKNASTNHAIPTPAQTWPSFSGEKRAMSPSTSSDDSPCGPGSPPVRRGFSQRAETEIVPAGLPVASSTVAHSASTGRPSARGERSIRASPIKPFDPRNKREQQEEGNEFPVLCFRFYAASVDQPHV